MKYSKDNIKANKPKQKYKIRDWRAYNNSLIRRGSFTILIPENLEKCWSGEGKYGYSDQAIEIMLVLKVRFRLPLRSVVGFARSIFDTVSVPDYTTLSRRAGKIDIKLKKQIKEKVSTNLDSTGLKVYGEGEWKVKIHGKSKRRTWTKIHIAIDDDGEIRGVVTTGGHTADSTMTDNILKQEEAEILNFRADGAYDGAPVYMSLAGREVKNVCIPPRKYSRIRIHGNASSPPYARDENLRKIRQTSRARWKVDSGYHNRSLVENTMFRLKTILGDRLCFRKKENQKAEALIKCNILNLFHSLGMPDSYAIAT
jgi:IS5 family transposase